MVKANTLGNVVSVCGLLPGHFGEHFVHLSKSKDAMKNDSMKKKNKMKKTEIKKLSSAGGNVASVCGILPGQHLVHLQGIS